MPEMDAELSKPRDRYHDIANAINAVNIGLALARQEVAHTGQGITQIQNSLMALQTQVSGVNDRVSKVENELAVVKGDLRTFDERFTTPRNIVYGMVALILTAVIVALIALVLKQ